MKKVFAALAATSAMSLAAPASAIVVGGVNFQPIGGVNGLNHIETATLAETLVNGVGQQLQGYGLVTTVNGLSNYCAVGTCNLYFYFYGYTSTSFSPTQVQFSGGTVDLYLGNGAPINLLGQNSVANVATITGLTPWARLTGHSFSAPGFGGTQTLNGFGTLTGASLTATGQGLLDAVGGFGIASVLNFLNGNAIGDNLGGFADIAITTSANNFVLNANDISGGLANGCATGQAAAGAWCFQGTLNARGTGIPEPGVMALLGLSLVGVGVVTRRRRQQA